MKWQVDEIAGRQKRKWTMAIWLNRKLIKQQADEHRTPQFYKVQFNVINIFSYSQFLKSLVKMAQYLLTCPYSMSREHLTYWSRTFFKFKLKSFDK